MLGTKIRTQLLPLLEPVAALVRREFLEQVQLAYTVRNEPQGLARLSDL